MNEKAWMIYIHDDFAAMILLHISAELKTLLADMTEYHAFLASGLV